MSDHELPNFQTIELTGLYSRYGIKTLSLFGSYAKGDPTTESDLDLLVEFQKPLGLITFIKVEQELSELLGYKVDLVSRNSLHPYLRDEVLSSAQVVHEAH